MARFYKHNIDQSRFDRAYRIGVAEERCKRTKGDPMVEAVILHLEEVCEKGLPDCYEKFEDFLYDFYPALSWKFDTMRKQILRILADSRFSAICEQISKDWDFDMRQELQEAITSEV